MVRLMPCPLCIPTSECNQSPDLPSLRHFRKRRFADVGGSGGARSKGNRDRLPGWRCPSRASLDREPRRHGTAPSSSIRRPACRRATITAMLDFSPEHGFDVLTYDYRGIGLSRPVSLRGCGYRWSDWGEQDFDAVLAIRRGTRSTLPVVRRRPQHWRVPARTGGKCVAYPAYAHGRSAVRILARLRASPPPAAFPEVARPHAGDHGAERLFPRTAAGLDRGSPCRGRQRMELSALADGVRATPQKTETRSSSGLQPCQHRSWLSRCPTTSSGRSLRSAERWSTTAARLRPKCCSRQATLVHNRSAISACSSPGMLRASGSIRCCGCAMGRIRGRTSDFPHAAKCRAPVGEDRVRAGHQFATASNRAVLLTGGAAAPPRQTRCETPFMRVSTSAR